MMMDVRFYGPLAAMIGEAITVDLPETTSTVGGLRAFLTDRHPAAAASLADARTRCFIHDEIAADSAVIPRGTTAEFLPPVSGG